MTAILPDDKSSSQPYTIATKPNKLPSISSQSHTTPVKPNDSIVVKTNKKKQQSVIPKKEKVKKVHFRSFAKRQRYQTYRISSLQRLILLVV